jgi:hypothetical protein
VQDFLAGPFFGGEYFLSKRFSVGVEAQIVLAFSDKRSARFGNPGKTNVNTATVAGATVYF